MDWKKFDGELNSIKPIFERLATDLNANLLVNDHDWPNLMLVQQKSNMIKRIQLYLNSKKTAYDITIYRNAVDSDKGAIMKNVIKDLKYPFIEITYEKLKMYLDEID